MRLKNQKEHPRQQSYYIKRNYENKIDFWLFHQQIVEKRNPCTSYKQKRQKQTILNNFSRNFHENSIKEGKSDTF